MLQKGRQNVTKRHVLMLQKGASYVTKRTFCYKKDLCLPFCNKICYRKDPEILHKGTLI